MVRPFFGNVGYTKIGCVRFEDGVEPIGHAVSLLGDLEVDLRYPRLY